MAFREVLRIRADERNTLLAITAGALLCLSSAAAEAPFLRSELIFPLEHWHNHGSCIVETPGGDLVVCWFHGSGERTADDVRIEGARLRKGSAQWSPRFIMADTPGYPDTNCCMFIDPRRRLWLLYPTILANRWETALMKYRVSSDYAGNGPPRWDSSEVLHVTPGEEFKAAVDRYVEETRQRLAGAGNASEDRARGWLASIQSQAADKLQRRLGWMTRAHPFVLDGKRLIVPLYSDGFSFSLMGISDDWGVTWKTSTPLIGAGNIQPSIVQRRDGSLYALMRDNGPPPKRLHQSESRDGGETWSAVTNTDLPNPGSGAEVISLRDGRWVLVGNDTERGRQSLAVQMSDDEGRTWNWKRHLELDTAAEGAGSFHYPSIIQASDGTLHVSYSYHLNRATGPDADGQPARKSIKHAHFNVDWVMQGDRKPAAP